MISQIVCDCVCSSVLSDNDQLGLIVTALCLHLHSHSRSHDLTHKARTCHFISSSVNREKCKRQRTTGKKIYMDWMCVEFCVYVQLIPHIFFSSVSGNAIAIVTAIARQLFGGLQENRSKVVCKWPISNCVWIKAATKWAHSNNTRPKNLC